MVLKNFSKGKKDLDLDENLINVTFYVNYIQKINIQSSFDDQTSKF